MGGISFLFAILFVVSLFYKNLPILITSFIMVTGGVMGLLDDLLGLKVKEYQKVVKTFLRYCSNRYLKFRCFRRSRITTDKS